jgi:hypothetical protein
MTSYRKLDDDEITALARTWLGSWPRPSVDVFVPIDDEPETA